MGGWRVAVPGTGAPVINDDVDQAYSQFALASV